MSEGVKKSGGWAQKNDKKKLLISDSESSVDEKPHVVSKRTVQKKKSANVVKEIEVVQDDLEDESDEIIDFKKRNSSTKSTKSNEKSKKLSPNVIEEEIEEFKPIHSAKKTSLSKIVKDDQV